MDYPSIEIIFFLVGVGFIAAFIDSVAGGGGIISIPALLFAGLPPSIALGTNKFAASMSSLTSSASFFLAGKTRLKLAALLFPLAFIGSMLGTITISRIPGQFLKPLVVVMLIAITIYTLFKKDWSGRSTSAELKKYGMILIAGGTLLIGFYDGFFGPGTGSFLLFMFLLAGFDFIGASANAKVLNLASNLASLLTFWKLGLVNVHYGLPMGLAMVVGALIGSQVALRKGAKFVKPMFITITTLLIGKQLWTIVFGP